MDTQTDEIDDLTRKLKASEKRIRDMESQNDKTQRDVKEYEAELSAVQKRYAERNEEYLGQLDTNGFKLIRLTLGVR